MYKHQIEVSEAVIATNPRRVGDSNWVMHHQERVSYNHKSRLEARGYDKRSNKNNNNKQDRTGFFSLLSNRHCSALFLDTHGSIINLTLLLHTLFPVDCQGSLIFPHLTLFLQARPTCLRIQLYPYRLARQFTALVIITRCRSKLRYMTLRHTAILRVAEQFGLLPLKSKCPAAAHPEEDGSGGNDKDACGGTGSDAGLGAGAEARRWGWRGTWACGRGGAGDGGCRRRCSAGRGSCPGR